MEQLYTMIYFFETNHPFSDFDLDSSEDIKKISLSDLQIDYNEENHKLESRIINLRKECAIKNLKKKLKDDENIQKFKFGLIISDHGDIHKGTPVLEAISNKRKISIIYNEEVLNESGAIELRKTKYNKEQPLLGNPLVALLVKELAKAVAKEVAKELFAQYFNKKDDNGIKEQLESLKDEIEKLFDRYKYTAFEDVLISNRMWLRDTYSERLKTINSSGISSIDWEGAINNLKSRQEKIKEIVDIIETRLSDNDIKNCSYAARTKGYLHAACSAMRIIIFREEVYLRNLAIKENLVTYSIDSYKNELAAFIKHAENKIKENANGFKDGRLGFLSSVGGEGETKCTRDPSTGQTFCYKYYGWSWRDHFESNEKKDPFKGGKIHRFFGYSEGKNSNKDEAKRKADESYNEHKDAVLKLMNSYITKPYSDLYSKIEHCKPLIEQ